MRTHEERIAVEVSRARIGRIEFDAVEFVALKHGCEWAENEEWREIRRAWCEGSKKGDGQ